MAGIYIHIPFCKKICYYCDFYKSANYRYVNQFIKTIVKEIVLKKNFTNEKIETIYFGGGTPSSIPIDEIKIILNQLYTTFNIIERPEITFEINPDDVNLDYLHRLRNSGINRLSIGIQSFKDPILKFLNRRHNATQSVNSIIDAQTVGFDNISIDLIYGIQNQTVNHFMTDLEAFFSFGLNHLSAYHLTIEENTQFGRMLKRGAISEVKETESLIFYNELINIMSKKNYIHYEISNFALPGYYSKHNMSYWKNVSYIGLGPSAHSYNFNSRFWNIDSVQKYIHKIENNEEYFEIETLENFEKFNEYIITGLRTKWGCDLNVIKIKFGEKYLKHCNNIIYEKLKNGVIIKDENKFFLSEKSLLQSDFQIEKFIIEK